MPAITHDSISKTANIKRKDPKKSISTHNLVPKHRLGDEFKTNQEILAEAIKKIKPQVEKKKETEAK